MSATILTITRPDDWHLHLRDGAMLRAVLPDSARRFARAMVMPNLDPPVRTTDDAIAYRERILAAGGAAGFTPLMTLYLTEQTAAAGSRRGDRCREVTDPRHLRPRGGVHRAGAGRPLTDAFRGLRIVFEHITTRDRRRLRHHRACDDRRDHHGPSPAVQPQCPARRRRASALLLPAGAEARDRPPGAAACGHLRQPKFFLGTDSAPHERSRKETACGCAGSYTAHAAIELYAEAFEQAGALDRLEGFASRFGPDFYRLPRNTGRITLNLVWLGDEFCARREAVVWLYRVVRQGDHSLPSKPHLDLTALGQEGVRWDLEAATQGHGHARGDCTLS
jgi:dihydroorotase